MNHSLTLIFFGRSGAGKGTQARLLVSYLERESERKALYIETGARFREFMKGGSHTSELTREVVINGGLMPEFLSILIWADFLANNFTGEEHLVLDGLSRRLGEAAILDGALRFYKRKRLCVVYLHVSPEKAFTRLKNRGRSDDSDEYIKGRLAWFDEHVVPAIDYFRAHPEYQFFEIDGEQSIEDVHKEIIRNISLNISSA